MNSYNKYPQCLYSLYALEGQTFDHSKMEVIFVDDASTDETPLLENYQPPYKFQYIRPSTNQGRSKAKNIGLTAAKGDIIIMLDAEVIMEPGFVERQYLYHQSEEPRAIAVCANHFSAYTVYDEHFNHNETVRFLNLAKRNMRKVAHSVQKALKKKHRRSSKKGKIEFLTKLDILQQKYKGLSFPTPFCPEITERFGQELNGFYLPWIFVITHMLSFKRSLLNEIGLFYEGFQGYGSEDWEFGYRLHKYGVKIIDDPEGVIYHQEHSRNSQSDEKESVSNYFTFFKRHYNFDIGSFCLAWIGKDLFYVNEVIAEYHTLVNRSGDRYSHFIDTSIKLLSAVFELIIDEKTVTQLLHSANISEDEINALFVQQEELKELKCYPYLTETMDFLLNL